MFARKKVLAFSIVMNFCFIVAAVLVLNPKVDENRESVQVDRARPDGC